MLLHARLAAVVVLVSMALATMACAPAVAIRKEEKLHDLADLLSSVRDGGVEFVGRIGSDAEREAEAQAAGPAMDAHCRPIFDQDAREFGDWSAFEANRLRRRLYSPEERDAEIVRIMDEMLAMFRRHERRFQDCAARFSLDAAMVLTLASGETVPAVPYLQIAADYANQHAALGAELARARAFDFAVATIALATANTHWVNAYVRTDGTFVRGHVRTNPDGVCWNNLSGC